ncbi:hypothetical protein N5C55_19755 [Pseudomonas otitidis]|uniref:hypothetical protein n=1 Tax=Metapseudomonas otitidis TaxID=319939 RepID=UPI002449D601|nr:hypothetical protein [Pseudomonas otitidis]MDH1108637.1 hypothetical protein [Pseudomonas otitidis]MDH1160410.1 hypothetical protein [Pseudomonas otitidis]MDH1166427.1 hypothetical protein [Pseudomonas otitidis]
MPPLKTTLHAPQLLLLAMLGAHASNSLADTPKLPAGSTLTAESHAAPPAVLRQVPLPGNLPVTPPISSVPKQEAPDQSAAAPKLPLSRSSGLQARSNAYTPLCTSLSVNQLYTLSGVQQGGSYCYHFEIGQHSKTEAVVTEQSAGTDFELFLLRDDGNGNLQLVGHSNQPGNADESILAVTPPGHYYWLMNAHASDGSPVGFGALVAAPIDAYEPNDSPESATVLPDTLNVITGNSDSAWDYDYYEFTSVRGQALMLMLSGEGTGAISRWILEIYKDGAWQQQRNSNRIDITDIPPQGRLKIRIRPNPVTAWSPYPRYRLTIGSKPFLRSHSLEGEYNVLRIPYSAQLGPNQRYMTTQAYRQINWSMLLLDSKNTPIKGITPTLYLIKQLGSGQTYYVPHPEKTDANGWARGTIDLGSCYGDWNTIFTEYSGRYKQTWRTYYNYGQWFLRVLEEPDIGVGNPQNYITLGHLCQQTLISSER